jgi:hypothetical protein
MSDNSNMDLDNSIEKHFPNLIINLQESFSSSNKSNNEQKIIKPLNKTPIKSNRNDHIFQKGLYQELDNEKTLFTTDNSEPKNKSSNTSVNLKYHKNKYNLSLDSNSVEPLHHQSPKKKKYYGFKMVEKSKFKIYESPTKNMKIEEEGETGRERRDYFGNVIKKKNKKKIKVSFVDEIKENKPLAEVIDIESYKKYNYIFGMPSEANFNHNLKTNCQCCITF